MPGVRERVAIGYGYFILYKAKSRRGGERCGYTARRSRRPRRAVRCRGARATAHVETRRSRPGTWQQVLGSRAGRRRPRFRVFNRPSPWRAEALSSLAPHVTARAHCMAVELDCAPIPHDAPRKLIALALHADEIQAGVPGVCDALSLSEPSCDGRSLGCGSASRCCSSGFDRWRDGGEEGGGGGGAERVGSGGGGGGGGGGNLASSSGTVPTPSAPCALQLPSARTSPSTASALQLGSERDEPHRFARGLGFTRIHRRGEHSRFLAQRIEAWLAPSA